MADGRWSGTLTGATGVTGTIRLTVAGRGRAITTFAFNLNCNSSIGSGSFSYGPDNNGQFIAANGTFSGPAAHSAAPALRIAWNGQFSTNAVTGTLANVSDPCGSGESVSATFTARHV